MNKAVFKNIYPKQVWTNENYFQEQPIPGNDERFGLLFPFIAGAALTAPLWYAAGANKAHQCPPYCPVEYQYQVQQPVQYYPYPVYNPYPPQKPIYPNTNIFRKH